MKVESITGIDGAGKTSVVNALATLLSPHYSVGVLTSIRATPYITLGPPPRIDYFFPLASRRITHLYNRGQELSNKLLVFAAFISRTILEGRFVRPSMLKNHNPDFILCDRDRSVGPLVAFWQYGFRGVPVSLMLAVVESLAGKTVTDDLYLLTVRPEIALRRLATKRDHHETIETLSKTAREYPQLIRAITAIGRVKNSRTINTEGRMLHEISHEIYQNILINRGTV